MNHRAFPDFILLTFSQCQGRFLEGCPDGEIAHGFGYGMLNDNAWWMLEENMDGSHSFRNNFGHRLKYAGHHEFWIEHQGGDLVALRTWTGHYLTDNPAFGLDQCWPLMIGQWECFHMVHQAQGWGGGCSCGRRGVCYHCTGQGGGMGMMGGGMGMGGPMMQGGYQQVTQCIQSNMLPNPSFHTSFSHP